MKIGTKSVLFGAHCFLIHPLFIALAWWELYGFPWNPRLWVAFFVHDLGYVGKPNMDGEEGERHPELGARIMAFLFDGYAKHGRLGWEMAAHHLGNTVLQPWGCFTLLHSRYLAKRLRDQPSRLCAADKLAISLTPAWLYLPMVRATGEIHEYRAHAKHRLVGNEAVTAEERSKLIASEAEWYAGVRSYCARWAHEHADGKTDKWTSDSRHRAAQGERWVWRW